MSEAKLFVTPREPQETGSRQESASSSGSLIPFADFDRIQIGDEAHCRKTISAEDLDNFARLSGDANPLHMDEEFARRTHFQRRVAHGMLLASHVSSLVGMQCPGAGALWSQQNFRWPFPVFIGDRIHLKLRVTHKSIGSRTLTIEVKGANQDGKVVMEGEGIVSVLDEQLRTKEVPLNERVALVTGTSSGIGAAIAAMLAQAGAAVVVSYRGEASDANELCATIEQKGGRALPVRMDVTDYASVVAGVSEAREKFDRSIDVLVNNSESVPDPRPFMGTSWGDVQAALDLDLRSAFHCCQAVIPGMSELKSGRIITIGSVFARNTPPANWSSFLMAKSALQSLTRSLAVELGPLGIRVNMVSPGLVGTQSVAGLPDRMQKVQAMQTPLRRLALPADIAAVVVALCSEAGQFITGTEIPVCGGSQM